MNEKFGWYSLQFFKHLSYNHLLIFICKWRLECNIFINCETNCLIVTVVKSNREHVGYHHYRFQRIDFRPVEICYQSVWLLLDMIHRQSTKLNSRLDITRPISKSKTDLINRLHVHIFVNIVCFLPNQISPKTKSCLRPWYARTIFLNWILHSLSIWRFQWKTLFYFI